ncbi:signal-induced proliferation-associated 1-like protein 2 isoform X1 [Electrophorus electricus]|uniref:signal-induced proliferation-associated 1-like protein 2 isoform X1 n=1 Tax=Electrophorus electricus TaxID=8005 RepID=UPI0015D047DF|nr:signal-induced proliferation-associated 1-like protein 2 isoform X1 [Electrophorus electricus]XP_035387489.1 signal-induced proliferation-associated 1-like protein 2 isoform X1 [Electrophorus electricus]XP_035387490.1 signal-induced proliferation-associated 1-like protein 2 isoform X1 [Electrophorus electricus]XP_035387491.1 signal-induced proliferation-associated 1-like protein 2 isoform X1 [Electrophorus electricus]XP_035387492.1 signal-induced proliferation-associated 1-like protein 2 iso
MQSSEELFKGKLKTLNGSMGPPATNPQGKHEGGGKPNGTPAMPKMGVRARVSDWPPKKELWDSPHGPNYENVIMAFQNGQFNQSIEISEMSKKPLELDLNDTKYSLSDILSRSPLKGLHPIRQRSNSDVTISDIDTEDVMDQNAINPNTGASLHREYGSTSSIDRQGLGGDVFFTLLKGYRVDMLDHRSAPPTGFPELLCCDTGLSPSLQTAAQIARGEFVHISGYDYVDSSLLYSREREKSFMRRLKSESSETSLFRKLRTIKSEHDGLRLSTEQDDQRPLSFQKCFAHYDVQSILFNVSEAVANRASLGQRKNTTTGASAASQYQVPGNCAVSGNTCSPAPMFEPLLGSHEDINPKENLDADEGDGKSNGLVLSCPHFRNEIGGEGERRISLSRTNSATYSGGGENCSFESSLSSHCTNAGVSVLEVPRENQPIHREKVKRYIIEHIDLGAYYYHKYFYGKDHQNYFGVDENLGPVAVSVRREKLEDGKEKEGSPYSYRIVFRTSQLTTLRGAVLEDAVPSTARHGTARGLPLKEVLEYVVPELNIHCLRLALGSPKVPEQLLKLDEQGLSFQHKVGVLYCKAGQSTEEEMYNNESAGPALDEFLDLLGQRVRLKGFTKYRAQLDNKTDSTGTHSLYTTYKDYELMFHVSTLLPYTPNNRQQLLRKRHIGNDIVTIVFQEPGALPFTPKNIRSHFQHVFVTVKVHNPCTEIVCYSVAVSRSKDVPPFGPPIPKGVTFPKSAVFRDFLLAKVINGENAAHKSEKFRAMATRTRQEYLKDLAENFVSTATVDSAVKFSFITLGAKKKERAKPRKDAHLHSVGAITWSVVARDFGQSADVECLLGISNEFIVLIEEESKNVVFNCSCRDVIGWTSSIMSIKIFYERGECVMFSAQENCGEDIREIVQRLEVVTRGCETTEMTLRRNGIGQLGFHVNFEGIVADVEAFGYAWKAGLRQGSRLVEICKVAVATLTHEQMIDLLRTSITVKVVIIQPHEDGTPRRGCSELYRIPMVEYKLDSEGTPCEYKTPFRRNTTWHRVPTTPAGQPLSRGSPTQGPERGHCQAVLQHSQTSMPRSTSFDRKAHDGSRMMQDIENPQISCSKGEVSQHYRSSPSNQSSSSDPGPCGSTTWSQQLGNDGSQSPTLHERSSEAQRMLGDGEVLREREHTLERACSAEAKWHSHSSKILNSLKERGKDSPSKLARGVDKRSSHSSSNTLSSSASSNNSEEKHFGSGDLMDPEMLGLTYIKGASTDSGIDTAPCCVQSPALGVAAAAVARIVLQERGGVEQVHPWLTDHPEDTGKDEEHNKLYLPQSYAAVLAAEHSTKDCSMGDLTEIASHSRSPLAHGSKHSSSPELSRAQACLHNSQDPGPSIEVHKHGLIRGAEERSSPDEPQNLSDCGQLYVVEAACRLQEGETATEGRLQASMSNEEYLKMMLPDSPLRLKSHRKASTADNPSPQCSLYRTLSDESMCNNRKGSSYNSSRSSMLDQALPNDILFSSTPPYHSTLPPRISLRQPASTLRNEFWFSDGSLADRSKFNDPGLMPLPDTATDLDWSHLVDAARAFEDQRVGSFCTMTDMQRAEAMHISQELNRHVAATGEPTIQAGDSSSAALTGKVNQLEVILRQLQHDLRKEKEDKAILQVEVQHLRQDNMRLQEESQTAAAQLRKFTEWFYTIDKKP